ncbi:translation initiation factor IF-2-like [Lagopus muta]|uniref:translation initiation factor IF-2-like n=1 Tax=Lagopus muta TaxID=64668 RepID=UPI0020A1D8F2|nr:translation initiation factor IF-2-like [Lagopus muta]
MAPGSARPASSMDAPQAAARPSAAANTAPRPQPALGTTSNALLLAGAAASHRDSPPILVRRQGPPLKGEPISARLVPGAGEAGRPSRGRGPAGHGRPGTVAGGRESRERPAGAPKRKCAVSIGCAIMSTQYSLLL